MIAPALLAACVLAAGEPARPVISVLYFDNNTTQTDYDVLRKGLADMIITDLVAWDGVTVVERDRLEAVLSELKLQRAKSFDAATVVKMGRLLGAQFLLAGSLSAAGPELRLDARLVRVEGGEAVATASVRGPKEKVFDLEQELVDKLTAGIDLKIKNAAGRRRVKVPDLDALLAYSKAIDLSDQGKVEEAQQAMQALVSKAPSFILARERREQIVKQLKEVEKRRGVMATASVLELGRRADAVLAGEAKLAELDEAGQRRFLTMRVIRSLVLTRLLKQHLSWREEHLRLILKGHEAQAIALMQAQYENDLHLLEEMLRHPGHAPNPLVDDDVAELLRDAKMEANALDPLYELFEFAVMGQCRDGHGFFTVGPALGDLDPKVQQAAFGQLEKGIERSLALAAQGDQFQKRQHESIATRLLETKAAALVDLGRDDDAVAAYQRLLDAFPNGYAAERVEHRIKALVGAEHEFSHEMREVWAKAMKDGCADDMDVNRSSVHLLDSRLRRQGMAGIAAHAAELEKACKLTPKTRPIFARVYSELASAAAEHEDCEAYRAWCARDIEMGGSVYEMLARQQHFTPWCELGEVVKSVMWMYAKLDRDWDLEFNENLVSILAQGGKRLTLDGRREHPSDSFALYLDSSGPDSFTCALAQWQRQGEPTRKGTCAVTLTHLAAEKGEFDEGSFSAHFEVPEDGYTRRIEVTDGRFRLRRQ